mgnify:CR=1 FL=1
MGIGMFCGRAVVPCLIGGAFFPVLIVGAVIAGVAYVVKKKKEETSK